MFFPRSEPLAPEEEQIFGLRTSLNTPIVALEGLTAGPARAMLLIHQEPDGRPNLTVGVRFLEAETALLYSFDGDLFEASGLGMGLDAALCFAESMGFLLDDDLVGPAADPATRAHALRTWQEHTAGPLGGSALSEVEASPGEPIDAPAGEAAAGFHDEPLTKFRRPRDSDAQILRGAEEGFAEVAGTAAAEEASSFPGFLRRLLSVL